MVQLTSVSDKNSPENNPGIKIKSTATSVMIWHHFFLQLTKKSKDNKKSEKFDREKETTKNKKCKKKEKNEIMQFVGNAISIKYIMLNKQLNKEKLKTKYNYIFFSSFFHTQKTQV